jgi:hypothetical protein
MGEDASRRELEAAARSARSLLEDTRTRFEGAPEITEPAERLLATLRKDAADSARDEAAGRAAADLRRAAGFFEQKQYATAYLIATRALAASGSRGGMTPALREKFAALARRCELRITRNKAELPPVPRREERR